jgi:peptidyl-prolyl cis-trans isomerase B (cyclophilin B)
VSTNQQRRAAAKRKLERQQARRQARAVRRKKFAAFGAAGTVVATVAVVVACSTTGSPAPGQPQASAAPPGACAFPTTPGEPAARPVAPPADRNPPRQGLVGATINTNQGVLPITLNRAQAPCTVASFVHLASAGFYNNTPCHRLTTDPSLKVLQCGDPTGQGTGGPGYTIPDEPPTGLQPAGGGAVVYPRGTIAMANTGQPNSGGSQFFLVYADSQLPPNYTVFGTIAEPGVQALNKVAAAGEDGSNGAGDGRPKAPTTIQSVTVNQS